MSPQKKLTVQLAIIRIK